MVELTDERDLDTLRQISLLLDRENQRLIAKNLQLTAELARLRGVADPEQLELALRQRSSRRARRPWRARRARPPPAPAAGTTGARPARAAHVAHRRDPSRARAGSTRVSGVRRRGDRHGGPDETSERVTTVKLTYHIEQHLRQKYRCGCNGAVVTAPGPAQLIPGGAMRRRLPWASPSRSTRIICRSNARSG